jgi:hypothetical protein
MAEAVVALIDRRRPASPPLDLLESKMMLRAAVDDMLRNTTCRLSDIWFTETV